MPEIVLKWWMGRGELAKIARALHRYWGRVSEALQLPLQQHDPLTAPIGMVELLGWQRGVTRLGQEPEALFRIRVAYAYQFTKEAGSIAGWEVMFQKLGYPHITQDERLQSVDWDVVSLQIQDGDLTEVPRLLDTVIRQYGRTCRRYQYTSYVQMPVAAKSQAIDAGYETAHIKSRINVPMLPKVLNMECEYYTATVKG
ncbi:phage tail protein [Photobacterium arenosum]|nr:phage tail protein [Photobacterium arenosum]